MEKDGDYRRRRALIICEENGATILKQMLESPNCKIVGGFGHGWEMVIHQYQLVDEILKVNGTHHE